MAEPIDPLERRLRDDLATSGTPELPSGVLEHVRRSIRATPQVRPGLLGSRAGALLAAVLVVAIAATAGPFLYGALVAPSRTAEPTAAPSPTPAPGTIPPSAPASATASPTPVPSPTPSPTPTLPSTPRPTPAGSPSITFDLRGTAWRLVELPGQSLTPETNPAVEFYRLTVTNGFGFSGCSPFSFSGTFDRGRATVSNATDQGTICRALAIRDAFMPRFRAITAWAVFGDVLVLTDPAGRLEFGRDLPPVGDPGRTLAQTLRVGQWRISSATGVRFPGGLTSILFSDHWLTSGPGACGFSSQVQFVPGGIRIQELNWDTGGDACATDERQALKAVLDAVTTGTVESSTRVRLAGPNGQVVLVRQ